MILALDLGGTKLASAIFSTSGEIIESKSVLLNSNSGNEVGKLIIDQINYYSKRAYTIDGIGISVPGISRIKTGTVWAPNIQGWDDYPLIHEVEKTVDNIPVIMDSDRACSIMGEVWKGEAQNADNAIFFAIGTGIGAGILVNTAKQRFSPIESFLSMNRLWVQ